MSNTFKNIRENLQESRKGLVVFSKKINRIPVEIRKVSSNSFESYVDGDLLDTFKSQKEAEKMTVDFVAELK